MVTLSYDGNRPVGVGSRKLGYDVDGRLTSDATRGISDILYSPNDRPVCVSTDEGTRLEYRYDATGRKLTEQTVKWEPLMRSWQIVKSALRVYVGPFEFSTLGDGISLERVNLPWGYLDANRREMRYIKDYQGNVLAVTDASGMLHQATDYTPYGQPSALSTVAANYGMDLPAADNRRLYGGKEYETLQGLNFHDFEARMLFNDRGLFNRPDPKAIDYPGFNPYLYCAGNPLRYVDPSGCEVDSVWPNIEPVIPPEVFVGWGCQPFTNNFLKINDRIPNCFDYSKQQLKVVGYTVGGPDDSNNRYPYSEETGADVKQLEEAVELITESLKDGIPVIIGVDSENGSPNKDETTDHFIVVVGMGNEENGNYIRVYDNATGKPGGYSENNKLYYSPSKMTISGRTETSYSEKCRPYIVSQVRKSIPIK